MTSPSRARANVSTPTFPGGGRALALIAGGFGAALLTTLAGAGESPWPDVRVPPAPPAEVLRPAATMPESERANSTNALENLVNQFLEPERKAPAAPPGPPPAITIAPDTALANPNLMPAEAPEPARTNGLQEIRKFQEQLEAARQARGQGDRALANRQLADLLQQQDAPDELRRLALFELALVAQEDRQLARAQQIFSQYRALYPKDPTVPEILLRQGLIYREMGATSMAVAKFYAVMTSALNLRLDRMSYYQRLVLQAQTEIADTYYLQGKFEEAADFFGRLMKEETPELNQVQVHYKLVRSLAGLGQNVEIIAQARRFLEIYPESAEAAEVRFLLASALKRSGNSAEALRQVLRLLEAEQAGALRNPESWAYWQKRAGNDIANQLYQEGDFAGTLQIYEHLARLDLAPEWRLPVWYQIGLVYERLLQPQKAAEVYGRIVDTQNELTGTNTNSTLAAVIEMARWRRQTVAWLDQANAHSAALRAGQSVPGSP